MSADNLATTARRPEHAASPSVVPPAVRVQLLATEHWSLLRGTPEATRELATMVGFNYQPGSPTQFAHSLLVSIVNPAGEIIYQQSGVNRPPQDAVAVLTKLVKGKK